jgi:hypothetical protein
MGDCMADDASLTIDEFCMGERFSRSYFYKLERDGLAPKTYRRGALRRITPQARDEWRAMMLAMPEDADSKARLSEQGRRAVQSRKVGEVA